MEVFLDFLATVRNVIVALIVSWYRFFVPPENKSVRSDIVLITGAARGLGQAMAMEFAKLGAVVVAWDINESELEETKDNITLMGAKCHAYVCDVRDREQVRSVGDRVRAEVGDVTMLVNNAGKVVGKSFLELTDDEIEDTFAVNLMAQIWTTREFLPAILSKNHGHIINIGSSCGCIGLKKLVDYSASKFGVAGFTQTLNYEIYFGGYDGVHTTLVSPSHIKTGMFKGCRMAYPTILPDLEVQPTVNRIMQAILTNQSEVCIPRMVYVMAALKSVIPVSAMHEIIQFFQADRFMEAFHGEDPIKTLSKEE